MSRFVRDLFTGELKEVPSEGGGRQIIARGSAPKYYDPTPHTSPYSRSWIGRAISVPIAQIDDFAEASRKAGTGATWMPDPLNPNFAVPVCDSRRARSKELELQGRIDKDSFGGDYCGK